jgi:hypothetical protein
MIEPRVRVWWIALLAVLGVAIYFISVQVISWKDENRLLREGVQIDALVEAANGVSTKGHLQKGNAVLNLAYDYNGKHFRVEGILPGRTEVIIVKKTVPIRIDPQDPSNWTGRRQPSSLGTALVAVWAIAPLVLISLLGGWIATARLIKLWRRGSTNRAVVVDARHAALAPRSRMIRCMLADGRDKRIYRVYAPPGMAELRKGDELTIIHNTSGNAVAVDWFA